MAQALLSMVLFWFLTVFVTQDHKIDLFTAIIWTFLSMALPALVFSIVEFGLGLEPGLATFLIALSGQVLVLWFALRFRFYVTSAKQTATILSGFLVGSVVIAFILR